MSESAPIKDANPLWHRLDNGLLRLVTWAARLGGLVLLMVGLFVLYEVVCRYVFQSPTLWVMDFSIYFVMWAVLLGSAYTMRTRGHVLVDVVIKKVSPANRRIVQIGREGTESQQLRYQMDLLQQVALTRGEEDIELLYQSRDDQEVSPALRGRHNLAAYDYRCPGAVRKLFDSLSQ